jgi:HrpA-like RNA helicase
MDYLATIDVTLFREYFFNCSIIEIEGRTFDVREYFLEDIIQLLNFQQINSMNRKQNNKNRQLQDDDDEQGYEDSQTDDIEVNSLSTNIKSCLSIKRMSIIIQFVVQNILVKLHQQ